MMLSACLPFTWYSSLVFPGRQFSGRARLLRRCSIVEASQVAHQVINSGGQWQPATTMPRAAASMLVTTNCSICPYLRISIFVHNYLPIQQRYILQVRACDTEDSRLLTKLGEQFQTKEWPKSFETQRRDSRRCLGNFHSGFACLADCIVCNSFFLSHCWLFTSRLKIHDQNESHRFEVQYLNLFRFLTWFADLLVFLSSWNHQGCQVECLTGISLLLTYRSRYPKP
jgi:hypothetical protein